jgi:uncharacterized membrane protein
MAVREQAPVEGHPHQLARVVERKIQALVERRHAEDRQRALQNRVADAVTWFAGSMYSVYVHLTIAVAWITWNLGWLGLKPFDASFVVLAMAASVEAIFLSTFVMITQNRMAAQADKRAELDLQISLLAEHEVTHLIRLVAAIAERLGIEGAKSADLEELAQDIAPEKVIDRMEQEEIEASR